MTVQKCMIHGIILCTTKLSSSEFALRFQKCLLDSTVLYSHQIIILLKQAWWPHQMTMDGDAIFIYTLLYYTPFDTLGLGDTSGNIECHITDNRMCTEDDWYDLISYIACVLQFWHNCSCGKVPKWVATHGVNFLLYANVDLERAPETQVQL